MALPRGQGGLAGSLGTDTASGGNAGTDNSGGSAPARPASVATQATVSAERAASPGPEGAPTLAATAGGQAGSVASDGGTPGSCLSVTVTTVTANGNYSPRNVGAIWIARRQWALRQTLAVWARQRIQPSDDVEFDDVPSRTRKQHRRRHHRRDPLQSPNPQGGHGTAPTRPENPCPTARTASTSR